MVCDNRSCMRNIRSEINYCLGNRSLFVSLTNLADLKAGKRGDGDNIWLEILDAGLFLEVRRFRLGLFFFLSVNHLL
jgi:hypothetical protein